MDGDDTPATVPPSPPSWTSLTLDDLAAIVMSKGDPTNKAESNSGGTDSGGPAMSEEERKRRRPQRQRGAPVPSPFALCHAGPPTAAGKSGSGVNADEVVISSVIGYALVRLEAHKDKITAATLEKPLSASDLLELTELQEILSAELKTSGRVPSITMRKDARATMSFGASNSLGSSSSSARQSVRSAPQSTNAFALDPAKLTACEPQVLLSLIREYCRVHIRLFPTSTQRALAACLDIKCTSFRLNAMHSLVYFLPSGNRTMLQYLLSFLGNLLKNGDKNGIAIDSLSIIFGPCLLRSRPEDPDREVALGVSILREMIEHYERLFVEFKDMTWRVSTDGISHLAVARVEQIVETAIDPNYLEEPFVDILFLTHDYYITSTQLLNHFIDLYERNKGKEEHMVDIRLRTLETVDYWVHCFRSCFDSAHTFLQRLEEFVAQLSKEIKQSTHSEEWAILVSLTECAEEKRRQANLSDEEKEKEEEEEKKGGINWLRKRRGSQLGNHRLSLNPQGKLSSALRAIRKSGSESKKGKKEREKGSGGESSSDMEAVPENGEPAKERRRSKGKDNKAKGTVGDAGSEGDSPKKTKTKTKTTKKKKGSFVMFRGLESGYKKMSADDTPMKENEKEGEKNEEAKAESGKNEAKNENENESSSHAAQEQSTDASMPTVQALAEVTESKEPEQEKRATEEKATETPPALAKEKEEGAKKVTMDATAETAQSGDGRASRGATEEAFARKAQLERSVTISSRTLYAMMGKGFQQMKASDAPSADQSADDRTSESSSAAKRRSGGGEELASNPVSSPAKPRREASPLARRKNEEDQNSSPSVQRNHSTEDTAVPAGGGGKRDSGEEAERRKKKAQSADKASARSERRLSRRATRADLNSASLSSSMSTTHIRERDPKREVVKERRGSFMIRTLSLSGSFAVPQKSLKDEHQREEHRATRDERKGSVSLASGQSWAGIVPVHSAKEDIEFLSADPGHIARQLTLMDWELFESINCEELLKGRFMQPDESPSFAAMVKRFNMTGQWVCCTLLKYETVVERAKAIEQCIKICAECQKLHNFNSFFAIVGGLNTTAISRLKGSWEKVPKRVTRLYKDIMELAATDGNFWNYRSVLKKTPLPLIPYLAICTQDLFKVEEKQTFVSGGMVYFEKMRLLWQFYSSFRKWQSAPYNFVVDRGMRAFLNDFAPLSEKEMYDRSYKVEPRTGSVVVV